MGLQEGDWPQSFITLKSFIYSARFSERVLSLETLREEISDSTVLFGGEVSRGYKQFQRWDHCVCPVPRQSKPETNHPQDGSIESDSSSWASARLKWSLKHLPTIKESLLLWAALGQAETSSPFEYFFNLPKCLTQSPSIALPARPPPTEQWREGF